MCERVMLHGETSHHWEHEKDTPWFVTITLIFIVQQFHSISKPVLSAYCKPGTLDTEARAWKRPAICPRGAYIAVRGTEKAVGRTDCYKDVQNGKQNTTFESGKGNTENYGRGITREVTIPGFSRKNGALWGEEGVHPQEKMRIHRARDEKVQWVLEMMSSLIWPPLQGSQGLHFPGGSDGNKSMWETWVQSLDQEDPLETDGNPLQNSMT